LENGTVDPIGVKQLQEQIVAAENGVTSAKALIKDAVVAENRIVGEVTRLEGFMSDPLYLDKWRVVKQLDDGVKNQMKLLDKNDEALTMFNTELKAYQNNLADAIDTKGVFKQGVLSDTQKSIDALAAKKAEMLPDARKAQEAIMGKNWDVSKIEELRTKFPKTMKALEADAEIMSNIKKGTLAVGNALEIIANKEREKPESEITQELQDVDLEKVYVPFEVPEEEVSEEVDEGAEDDEFLTAIEKGTTSTEAVEEEKKAEEVPAGEVSAMPKIGDALLKGFGSLAAYAPAIYNISKGLEKPDKVERRFVSPQTKKYQNMSQPQLNMIDDAFNAAVGNARNTSGGLMSNFRSNIEGAWANRIKNTAQVNAFEAERADKVASENINTMNVAEQYNQEVAGKADVMDAQSKAATNALLAQGVQDIANITSRNRADAMALRNQEIMRNAISSGTNMTLNADGTISFNPGSVVGKKKEDGTTAPVTTKAATVATTTAPIIQTPKPITPFDVAPTAFGPATEDYYYNTKR
jgi:hypothetical protein